jgi:hypothetical protein
MKMIDSTHTTKQTRRREVFREEEEFFGGGPHKESFGTRISAQLIMIFSAKTHMMKMSRKMSGTSNCWLDRFIQRMQSSLSLDLHPHVNDWSSSSSSSFLYFTNSPFFLRTMSTYFRHE